MGTVLGVILTAREAFGAADPPESRNAIGISLSVAGRSQRDEVFNRTRYAGPLGGFGLSYLREDTRSRHLVSLAGGAGQGWNRYGHPLLWIDLGLRYAFDHIVFDRSVRVWLGGSAGGGPGIYQFSEEDSDHIYWTTLYDLAPRLTLDGSLRDRRGRRNVLEVQLELPLLGLVSRPPPSVTYNNDKPSFGYLMRRAHREPHFASFHNVQSVRVEAGWRLRLSKKVAQRLAYGVDYTRVAAPAPVAAWTHTFMYRLDLLFGR